MERKTQSGVLPHLCAQRIPGFTLHPHQAPQSTRCCRSRRSLSDSHRHGGVGSSRSKNARTRGGMSGTAAAKRSDSEGEGIGGGAGKALAALYTPNELFAPSTNDGT